MSFSISGIVFFEGAPPLATLRPPGPELHLERWKAPFIFHLSGVSHFNTLGAVAAKRDSLD